MTKNFDEPLINLDVETLDGRVVKNVSVNLERGPLPVYSQDRLLIGKITDVTFSDDGTVYVSGVVGDEADLALNRTGSGLAAEISISDGELRAAQVSDRPAFDFSKKD